MRTLKGQRDGKPKAPREAKPKKLKKDSAGARADAADAGTSSDDQNDEENDFDSQVWLVLMHSASNLVLLKDG